LEYPPLAPFCSIGGTLSWFDSNQTFSPEFRASRFRCSPVIRAHHAQRARLMVREFVVGIAMLRAQHACHSRMALGGTIRIGFDAMRQTSGNVPSRWERDGGSWASSDAGASATGWTRIEAVRAARMIKLAVEQKSGAKSDPGSKHGVNNHADNARAGEARQHRELHEIQSRGTAEGIDGRAADIQALNRINDLLLDDLTGEIVERIIAVPPTCVCGDVRLKPVPEISAAIPDHYN
jgi:hypothetical protein